MDFFNAVDAMLSRIEADPEQFPPTLEDPRYHRALLHRFPYAVFFEIEEKEIWVVAVVHTSRRPDFWRERLSR